MVFITHCDSPAFWQTYLSDPASITMEGILIFNKHLLFLLTVIVIFSIVLLEMFVEGFSFPKKKKKNKTKKVRNTVITDPFFTSKTVEDDLPSIKIFVNFFKFKRKDILQFTNADVRVTIDNLPPGITSSDFGAGIMHPLSDNESDSHYAQLIQSHFRLE